MPNNSRLLPPVVPPSPKLNDQPLASCASSVVALTLGTAASTPSIDFTRPNADSLKPCPVKLDGTITRSASPDASSKILLIDASVLLLAMLIARITATPSTMPSAVNSVRVLRVHRLRKASAYRLERVAVGRVLIAGCLTGEEWRVKRQSALPAVHSSLVTH